MISDLELLHQFARDNHEAPFGTLVDRHLKLVYSAALRQVRSPQLAEEVSQSVFCDLARNAAKLEPRTILTAWLYQVTRRTAIDVVRRESRRQLREQIALEMTTMHSTPEWTAIEPLLDEAMETLDRAAILLRYFEDKSLREVGQTLGTSEDAAQKRVSRALDQLREFFSKRGRAIGVGGLAAVLCANSVQAAPIGLAQSVTLAAVKATVVATSNLTLIKTTLKIMASTKLKTAAVIGLLGLLVAGTATVVIHKVNAQSNPGGTLAKPPAFAFAGYATPENSLQSMLWAMSLGDLKKVEACLTPEQVERFRAKLKGKSDEEIRDLLTAWANSMIGFQLREKQIISDGEVRLLLLVPPFPGHPHVGNDLQVMQKVGDDWKYAGKWGVDIKEN